MSPSPNIAKLDAASPFSRRSMGKITKTLQVKIIRSLCEKVINKVKVLILHW